MDTIIREVTQLFIGKYTEELQKLFTETRDISEFIMGTKDMLDKVGARLIAQALESLNEAVKNSPERKHNWSVKNKGDAENLTTIFGEVGYKRTYYRKKRRENIAIFRMNW